MKLTVNGKGLHGSIPAIASKSMAHRLLICAALSGDPSQIRCETLSDDIKATASCLRALGCDLAYAGGTFYASPAARPERATVDCGESGSTLRFLLPVVAALGISCRLDLHGRLPSRPLSPLYGEMVNHGAKMSPEGSNPLLLSGKMRGGTYTIRADVSSQFISGLLFALPLCEEDSRIVLTGKRESASYIEMTLCALRAYGIKVTATPDGYAVPGKQKYRSPGTLTVEGDWSNGAFWLAAASLGAPLTVTGLDPDSLQGDRKVADALREITKEGDRAMIDAQDIPDLVPILSVVAAAQKKTTVIYNAARLRLKESDRIETTAALLKAIGASVTQTEDGLRIKGDAASLHSGKVDSANDHRIAMAAAIASVVCGSVEIDGAEAVNKSYPAFFEDFRKLGGIVAHSD
ncbi:MAG: 3-phosphoshikimate 1-carboxyvinyltransferase [Ruminococcaceae bacterium]|nr:3-phosphoshikimate 1-carboxyvinyltransferase [Oscillospiraceae bacterium]